VTEGCGKKIDLLRRFTAVSEARRGTKARIRVTRPCAELGTLRARRDNARPEPEQQCLDVPTARASGRAAQVGNLSGPPAGFVSGSPWPRPLVANRSAAAG